MYMYIVELMWPYILPYLILRLSNELDNASKESREKETKILNLTRELDELREMYEKAERNRLTQQRELEDLISSSSDVGKNVSLRIL